MNAAYKHLDNKMKLAELTIGQWAAVLLGVGVAILWGFYASPLPLYPTLFTAVYLGAMPIGAAVASALYEVNVTLLARSALTWRRLDGRYVPGPGESAKGYVVRPEPDASPYGSNDPRDMDIATIWDA